MSRSLPRRLAWSLFAIYLSTVASILALVLWSGAPGDQLFVVVAVGFAVVGVLIASREPANAIGWLLLAAAVSIGLEAFGNAYIGATEGWGELVAAWFAVQSVWLYVGTVLLPLVYPNGRLLSPRWRAALWLGILGFALGELSGFLRRGPFDLDVSEKVENPIGVADPAVAAGIETLGNVLLLVAIVLSATAIVLRFRRSHGRERLQLKVFVYVMSLAVTAITLSIASLFGGSATPGWLDGLGAVGWFSTLALVTLGMPIAIGVAILRHRLYDIDLVIKRTLVYGALTATLVATYLALVLVLRLALGPVTGDSDLAVAGSTLAVAALFRPARARIQAVVDRRFYRARYDAARTLDGFAVHLRDELDLEALAADLGAVVHETVQPAHVTVWLRKVGP